MKLSITSFKGISPKILPRYLPDGAAQVAINVVAEGQSVRPMRGTEATGHTVPFQPLVAGIVPTIYKAGVGETSDTKYWLSSYADVSVCRNQIAGDTCEWTFFADKGTPTEVTNKTGWEGKPGQLPATLWRLGIPAPTEPLTGWVNYVTPETTGAALTLGSADLAQFITYDYYRDVAGFYISTDKGANWFYPTALAADNTQVPGVIKASVLLSAADLAALVVADGMIVSVNGGATRPWFALSGNTQAAVIASLNVPGPQGKQTVTAVANGTGVEVFSRAAGGPATLYLGWNTTDGQAVTREQKGTALTPSVVMAALSGQLRHAVHTAYFATGSHYFDAVLVTSGGQATGVTFTTRAFCQVGSSPNPAYTTQATCESAGGAWVPNGEDRSLTVKWGGGYAESKTATGTTEDKGSYESRIYVYTWTYSASCETGEDASAWVWESAPSPPSEVANVYADSTVYVQRRTGEGTCSIAAHTTQQACSLAGGIWAPKAGSTLQPPTGYQVNGIRVYRSVSGQYLFVTEGKVVPGRDDDEDDVNDVDVIDNVKASGLGEPCPSITWSPPPSRKVNATDTEYLNGIINLPNGMVAGFLGRDIYFCEPYRPFAWPENYIQTLDDPVVGLGRMDTTLAVLTTGNPYFIQGSEPSNMNVVKADLEQACVSKRSIVSMGRQVFYASPDGLVMLTPGGSTVITEALFDRTYWQALHPENIHAYGHDNKYVAFFGRATIPLTGPSGTVYQVGGFVLDTASKQFYLHGFPAQAGYHDLHNDTLYLATATSPSTIVKWGQGAPVAVGGAVWRSKMFGLPQGTGFSCGQVEAGPLTATRDGAARAAYPGTGLTVRIYADGALFHTQTIANTTYAATAPAKLLSRRAPFRLPPLNRAYCSLAGITDEAQCIVNGGTWVAQGFIGRDWEIELNVDSEIFNVVLAQSMSEIASV